FQSTSISMSPYFRIVAILSPVPLNTCSPLITSQPCFIALSAACCLVWSSVADRDFLLIGLLTNPFHPLRSLPLNKETKPFSLGIPPKCLTIASCRYELSPPERLPITFSKMVLTVLP